MPDTIAAIATGGVLSAIGIIRVSGDDAIVVADKVFSAKNGTRLSSAENRLMYYGSLSGKDGSLIDLCLCMVSRQPDSYTGEDTVEFHCHGSPVVLSEVLDALFSFGVRQAVAGEFTKRAFLSGRMDLTQAEAVIDLIEAETAAAAQNAAGQLNGAVSLSLEPVYDALLDIIAHFHAVIDYPDEDIDEFEIQKYLSVLRNIENELSRLLSTFDRGRILRDGLPTVIAGRPNTGKSSLLNILLGYDRAIVTGVAGTTRDTIEEKVQIGGLILRLTDTAGLRKTNDDIEKLGVERTFDAMRRAGLVILVLDGSGPPDDEDFEALRLIPPDVPRLVVVNKSDLPHVMSARDLDAFGSDYCRFCALTGEGMDEFENKLHKLFPDFNESPAGQFITNRRQAEALGLARSALTAAIDAISMSITPDAILGEIETALDAIGDITGKTMREDILTRIFERFCVGK